MKKPLPIIHIIGLPGVGKSTLARKLAKKLKLPLYGIGEYRDRFPMSIIGEADAWVSLFSELSRRKWRDCILETTGLNSRESFLKTALPGETIVTIKLEAQRKVLYARLGEKEKSEQGDNRWLFGTAYRDKREFVRKLFKAFRGLPAGIRIDTSKLKPQEVYKVALKELEFYRNFYDYEQDDAFPGESGTKKFNHRSTPHLCIGAGEPENLC